MLKGFVEVMGMDLFCMRTCKYLGVGEMLASHFVIINFLFFSHYHPTLYLDIAHFIIHLCTFKAKSLGQAYMGESCLFLFITMSLIY
jgi:hypothetical protein